MTGARLSPVPMRRLGGALLLLALLTACGKPEPLRVGLLAGLSGSVADLGESGRAGAQLAVEEINQAGGVRGRPLELRTRDDAQDPATARSAVAALAGEGVVAIVGPMTSSMAQAVLPATTEAGLVLLSPTASASSLARQDDALLMLQSTTRYNARQAADYHARRGLRRVAALYDTRNRVYTQDWITGYREASVARGVRLVQAVPFTSGQEDSYLQAVRQLRSGEIDGLMFVANAVDTVRLLLLARQNGLRQPALGDTWSATEQLLELGGQAVEGMSSIQLFNRELDTPRYQGFLRAYRARFSTEPGFASVAAYDAVQALAQALRQQEGGETLKQALLKAGPYEGLQERWNFDAYGDVRRQTFVTIVRAGRFVVVN